VVQCGLLIRVADIVYCTATRDADFTRLHVGSRGAPTYVDAGGFAVSHVLHIYIRPNRTILDVSLDQGW
jgi:hypothetical protein